MEPEAEASQQQIRSGEMGFLFDEIHGLISGPPVTNNSSFTALLELPPPQAVELLVKEDFQAKHLPPPIFPSNIALIQRASKFSTFASVDNSPESNTILPISNSMKLDVVKQEQLESDSHRNSSPAVSDQCLKSCKRKEVEKKAKESNKKSKKMAAANDGGEDLPYVHVRARRGQATDSHSLAERARREKINARMKLLQQLVPGCNKISGTAMVLDEIINHVQGLQRQVEFLSMRLATVDPRIDFNLDSVLTASGSSNENGYTGMPTPSIYPDGPINGSRQPQYQQLWHCDELQHSVWGTEVDNSNFITSTNSLLHYDSSPNSASQLKMEQ
ncbi:hypothetical protein ACS0TY_025538 [Phlomoides rotata]